MDKKCFSTPSEIWYHPAEKNARDLLLPRQYPRQPKMPKRYTNTINAIGTITPYRAIHWCTMSWFEQKKMYDLHTNITKNHVPVCCPASLEAGSNQWGVIVKSWPTNYVAVAHSERLAHHPNHLGVREKNPQVVSFYLVWLVCWSMRGTWGHVHLATEDANVITTLSDSLTRAGGQNTSVFCMPSIPHRYSDRPAKNQKADKVQGSPRQGILHNFFSSA